MDRGKIIDALGLVPGGGISILDMQMVQWGRDIVFECEYLVASMTIAPDTPVLFRLVFKDCREIKYRVYAHLSAGDAVPTVADVVEIALGQGHHRRDANILTNCFSITLSYDHLVAEHETRVVPIKT